MFGAEFRRVEDREHLGKPAVVAVATRTYDTTAADLWEAITTPTRLARWFLPVTGDLHLGGRYQLQGNAGGEIVRCDPPTALELTWEFGGATSWVHVRLVDEAAGRVRFTLEHITHRDGPGKDHFAKFGPGAVGIGWDLTLDGLARHVGAPGGVVDPAAAFAWMQSPEGKAAMRASGAAWCDAHVASGSAPADEARAMAARTIAFYTGEAAP